MHIFSNDSIGVNDATIEIKIVHKKVIIIVVGFVLFTKAMIPLVGPVAEKRTLCYFCQQMHAAS